MLTQQNPCAAVASPLNTMNIDGQCLDKKTRERLAIQRRMAARRAIERHFEQREMEHNSQEYWFDG